MKFQKQKVVRVDSLKFAPHNPKGRTEVRKLKALVRSMSEIGLIYPIVVDEANVVIDGHRRATAARELGWEELPAIVMAGDRDAIYASVNVTAKKMGGNDALTVWLKNPAAVTHQMRWQFERAERVVGRPLLERVCDAGLSLRVYRTADQIARYCDDDSPETVKAILEWLLKFATIGQVMKAMEAGESPRLILKAVREMKPVRMRLAITRN
jgi:hypothetical protein